LSFQRVDLSIQRGDLSLQFSLVIFQLLDFSF
jgi:hypothetical protein